MAVSTTIIETKGLTNDALKGAAYDFNPQSFQILAENAAESILVDLAMSKDDDEIKRLQGAYQALTDMSQIVNGAVELSNARMKTNKRG